MTTPPPSARRASTTACTADSQKTSLQIRRWPDPQPGQAYSETFTGPKGAKRRQHDTDGEFERVFGNPRQRPMHGKADGAATTRPSRKRAGTRGKQRAASGTQRKSR